ncbi:hypothetical protein [Thauera humireducens]
MAFKLIVFIGDLIAIAVLGSRAYSASVARFGRQSGSTDEADLDELSA